MFFCRHDQFAASAARQIMPVEPEWLIEAFGVVTFDSRPTDRRARFRSATDVCEIRTPARTAGQNVTDHDRRRFAWRRAGRARLRRAGQRLASAVMSKHVRDPASGVTLPRHVEIQLAAGRISS